MQWTTMKSSMFALAFISLAARDFVVVGQSSRNVRISSDGNLIVATQSGSNPLVFRDGSTVPLPSGVTGFDDLYIDNDNGLLFALWTRGGPDLCSWKMENSGAGDLTFVNCISGGGNWAVTPFTGLSCLTSVCVISGGVGGYSVISYNPSTGELGETRDSNINLDDVIGHPDVELVSTSSSLQNDDDGLLLAAFSTDFSRTPRFGTMLVDLSTNTEVRSFGVQDSLSFSLSVNGRTNFPLVSSFFKSKDVVFMFTANGGMTVQDIADSSSTEVLAAPVENFRAVTTSVDQNNARLVMGGLINQAESFVIVYDLSSDPLNPLIVDTTTVDGRITSIAANGGIVAYVGTEDGSGINFVPGFEQAVPLGPTPAPEPTSATTTMMPTSQAFSVTLLSTLATLTGMSIVLILL